MPNRSKNQGGSKMKMILVLMTIGLAVLAVFPLVAAPIQRLSTNAASWRVTGWSGATSGTVPIAASILIVGLMIRTWRHPQ